MKQLKNRILKIILGIILLSQLTACSAGYTVLSLDSQPIPQRNTKLADLKFNYIKDQTNNLLNLSLERTLRGDFNIIDLTHSLPNKDPQSFEISFERTEKGSVVGLGLIIVHFFSAGIIPAIMNTEHSIVFSIITPDGDSELFKYTFNERVYGWLPFLFLGADYYGTLNGGFDLNDEKRLVLYDELVTQFIIDATPFILSHIDKVK